MDTILIVDDDLDIVKLATLFLTHAGFHVFGTTDPEEAIRLVETNDSIKLVLSDISMPKMDGPEVVRHALRARHDDVKVIFMSGGFEGVRFRQTDRLLSKPLTFESLVREIRATLADLPSAVPWEGTERRRQSA
jgi:two-component system cell cycle sensor histidine kinase/response regulator CckA